MSYAAEPMPRQVLKHGRRISGVRGLLSAHDCYRAWKPSLARLASGSCLGEPTA